MILLYFSHKLWAGLGLDKDCVLKHLDVFNNVEISTNTWFQNFVGNDYIKNHVSISLNTNQQNQWHYRTSIGLGLPAGLVVLQLFDHREKEKSSNYTLVCRELRTILFGFRL